MNVLCSAEPCPIILNATCVRYEGSNLIYTGIVTNDNLQTALEKIDSAFQAGSIGYGFENGITKSFPSNIVRLGGPLTQDTIITSSGFTLTVTDDLIAGRHITTGGTASQFVKGDGSLDSASYQPSGSYITGLSGDGTATGPGVATFTLNNVNAFPGTYGSSIKIPVITVNSKGLVTNIVNTNVAFPNGQLIFVGDVIGTGYTGSNTVLTLATVNSNVYTSNTFLKFSVNGKGLVTSAAPIVALDITNTLGYTPVPDTRTITINGVTHDLSANRSWTISGGGSVTAVTASSPLASSGGTTPNISIQQASGSQNGYLSSTDWTTFNNKIGGSGTATRVAFWDTSSSLSSSSNLYWDNINNRLGIGTTTPSRALDVVGQIGATNNIVTSSGNFQTGNGQFDDDGIGGGPTSGFSVYTTIQNRPVFLKPGSSKILAANYCPACLLGDIKSVGISDNGSPETVGYKPSVLLGLDSTSRGFLLPKLTTVQKTAITSPETGLQVYDSTVNKPSYYNGSTWIDWGTGGGGGTVTSVQLSAGTGISLSGTNPITTSGTITVTNSAPDQTVALTAGTGISVTGTYPNFTIANTASSTVTTDNVLYVAKNGNDGTGTRNKLTSPYLTIQAAITAASSGDMVYVYPGTYNESIVLKNGVNIYFTDGAIISNNTASIVTDNNVAVTCVIDGYGEFINTSTSSGRSVFVISNASSNIIIRAKYVENNGYSGACLYMDNGTVRYEVTNSYSKTYGSNKGIYILAGTLYFKGEIWSDLDYTILISSATVYIDGVVKALNVGAYGNSAIHMAGTGYVEFTGYAVSNKLFGWEMSGGTAYIHDAVIESKATASAADGSAISYYGGTLLELSNVVLKSAHASAKCIETQGVSNREVKVYTSSYASNAYQTSPAINFTFGKQNILVSGTNLAHAALNTDAKVVVDQLAMNTPANNDVIKYNSGTGKAEWASAPSGGTTRSINPVSGNTSAGSTANTDYYYFVSALATITLPTAVSNTNQYTIKRTGAGVVTIATTSSQTIDGSLTVALNVINQSVTLISDGSNWQII